MHVFRDLEHMGAALASALADYWDPLSYGGCARVRCMRTPMQSVCVCM